MKDFLIIIFQAVSTGFIFAFLVLDFVESPVFLVGSGVLLIINHFLFSEK
jgi:hypothetical protein